MFQRRYIVCIVDKLLIVFVNHGGMENIVVAQNFTDIFHVMLIVLIQLRKRREGRCQNSIQIVKGCLSLGIDCLNRCFFSIRCIFCAHIMLLLNNPK